MKRNDWVVVKSVGNVLAAAKARQKKLGQEDMDVGELGRWICYLEYRAKLPCGQDGLLELDIDDLELFGILERT